MGALSIELDSKVKPEQCSKCGLRYHRVHGFVYDGGNAFAVYWAAIYVGHLEHPGPRIDLTIAIGDDWGDESDPTRRCYASLDVWPEAEQVRMAFQDVDGAPLKPEHFGSPLTRASALGSPFEEQFFRVADKIVYDDPRVSKALGTHP